MFAIADHPDRDARDRALGDWLEARGVELVVLAGFMELLGPEFVRRFTEPDRERASLAAARLPRASEPSSRRSSTGSR